MHFAKISSAQTSPAALRSLFTKSVLSVAALGFLGSIAHAAEPRLALAGAVPPSARLRSARPLGRLDAQTPLRVALTLPLRNQDKLADLLRRQYTPGDPLYHQFLTPPDFTAQYGPTQQDYDTVAAYARAQGLTVIGTSPGRTLLSVAGPTAKIEAAFGVQMSRYRLPDNRVAFSNSAAPTLPRSVAVRVAGIAGLNNIAQMHPHLRRKNPGTITPLAPVPIGGGGSGPGSGPLGGIAPNDIKYAYDLSTITPLYGTTAAAPAGALTGAGQNIGLFELDGYLPADVAAYTSTFSLPTALTGAAASVTAISLSGSQGPLPVLSVDGQTEVTLDIDMILALAPSATGVYVYEDDPNTDASATLNLFTRMANDLNPDGSKKPLLQAISCSWGITEDVEDPAVLQSEDMLFQQMAAQGQSLFCAAGDNGAYDAYGTTGIGLTAPSVDNPASQPYATGVGGTTLGYVTPSTMAGTATAGAYVSETVWSAGTSILNPEGSGGGVSDIWVKPSYQLGFGVSAIKREVPDVTLNADPNTGYSVIVNNAPEVIGGTSAAAPLWAAYTALINEQRAANGLGPVGFMNPVLYPISTNSASYASDFHDITTGSNLFYQAAAGYDDASGLGSFIGAPLLAALSANANAGTGTGTVSGTVTDSSTPAVPIAGATVSAIVGTTGVTAATTTTDATGAYTLSAPSGLSLKITVATGTVTSPTAENFSGTSVTLAALTAGGTATQNFILPTAFTYASGLQMISAPFDYTGIGDFAAAFGLSETQAQTSPRLVQYEPSLSSYVFFPTAPADTLRLGQGYWIRFPSASYLHITGTPASIGSAYSIPLQQGWNQIGDPFLLSAPLSGISVVSSAGTTLGLLGASSTAATVQPTLYGFNGTSYVALMSSTDALTPYVGDWVFAFQKCSLSVPVPAGATPPPLPFASHS